ncbi:hypothetical protein MNB_SV-4-359 [hydrothermal vent metagenome]|uniref:Uncharacterized protein n=1 Tax=hydrothermal vent metagenome TaxID=652676 RepID=A0A1W1E8M4_9ZZZZ
MTELEKIGKNLFRMFRDGESTSDTFVLKFTSLKEKLDQREAVRLESEYHQMLKEYIERLYRETCMNDVFDDIMLDNIRDAEMSNLNRLQKLKNASSYKKAKHRQKEQHEDWG